MGREILFEIDKNINMLSIDSRVINEAFEYYNWYNNGRDIHKLYYTQISDNKMYRSIKDMILNVGGIDIHSDIIPVGSIEFVEMHLGRQIKAINIPDELRDKEFTGRETWVGNKNTLNELLSSKSELFVKHGTVCKRFEPMIVRKGSTHLDLPNTLFISEVLHNIESEHRIFIYKGKILDSRLYCGNYRYNVDFNLVDKMVHRWKNAPLAYTLDVAVTSDNKTVIIEAHNFISCGLYGFENYSILPSMIISAYTQERDGGKM